MGIDLSYATLGHAFPDASLQQDIAMAFFQPQQTKRAAEPIQSAVPVLQPWVEK